MSATQARKEALGAVLARQNRVMANDLGYQENDRKCPLCHDTYWHASDDPALTEAPLRTSCCRKIVGAECFRLFLSPNSDAGGNNSECPICRTTLLESGDPVRDDQASTASVHFRKQVKLFQETRKLGIRTFRQERARADCALYEELYEEGVKLPAPLDSNETCFGGSVEPSQRSRGLDSNQGFALFFALQREGAFKPNDSNDCALDDTELYKNLRKMGMFYCLRYARWQSRHGDPIFINHWGTIGTVEELAQDRNERMKKAEERRKHLSDQASHESPIPRRSQSSGPRPALRHSQTIPRSSLEHAVSSKSPSIPQSEPLASPVTGDTSPLPSPSQLSDAMRKRLKGMVNGRHPNVDKKKGT